MLCLAVLGLVIAPCLSLARDKETFSVTIKDHLFDPSELTIPANKKVKLVINNEDPTEEEFESFDLNREKIVSGHGKIIVFIGPLKAGIYEYFGDFHKRSARGKIIVK